MPAPWMAKVASDSGKHGESNTLQMRFSPRLLRRYLRAATRPTDEHAGQGGGGGELSAPSADKA
eukprot:6207399-Pleurochrysis_carterae.AAC.3